MKKHYDADYLNATAQATYKLKQHTYDLFKNISKGAIVDLGCGTGADVLRMSEQYGDEVKIIGVDHDSQMISEVEKETSSVKKARAEFIQANAEELPFQDASLEGLRAERLIQHIASPEAVFAEIHRVLKTDSLLVIIETDWTGLSIFNNYPGIEQKIKQYLTVKKINNGFASRNLYGYLSSHNFRKINIEIFPLVSKSLADANKYLMMEKILAESRDADYINEEEYVQFKASLLALDQIGCFVCSLNMVVFSAIK
ncbi:MAG: methyltransferase domain-containing protein [Flavobacteriales bacterium]|nr:methyltransferase domain-containing protein [Flavobacteriales bacterium]